LVVEIADGTRLWHTACYAADHPPIVRVPHAPPAARVPTPAEIRAREERRAAHTRKIQEAQQRAEERGREAAERAARVAEKVAEMRNADVCDIFAGHHDLLKDDPERLPTDFLRKLIGRKDPCPDEAD